MPITLYADALRYLDDHITYPRTISELKDTIHASYIGKINWCGEQSCGANIGDKIYGEILGESVDEKIEGTCIGCGKPTASIAYFSRRASSP